MFASCYYDTYMLLTPKNALANPDLPESRNQFRFPVHNVLLLHAK